MIGRIIARLLRRQKLRPKAKGQVEIRIRRARRPDAPLSAIPTSLLDRRLARNLRQDEVAEELGTTRGTYSTIEGVTASLQCCTST